MPRYLKTFLVTSASLLIALASFNFLIDPYNIYGVVQSPALDAAKLECSFLISRVAKAEMLRNSRCEVLVLGSSRAEVGINPRCAAWNCDEVYNLGLSGTCIAEAAQVCRYAIHTKPLKRIVLLADFDNFADNDQQPKLEETRCNEQKDAVEYHLGKLLGIKTAKSSLTTLRRYRRGPETTTWTIDRGHLRAPLRDGAYHESFDRLTRQFLQQLYLRYVYSGRSMQSLAQIVADCRQANVELIVVLSPIHALHLETIHQAGLWPTFERWKRDLVETLAQDRQAHSEARQVALWDFTGYSPYTCEAVPAADDKQTCMRWYLEWSHFTPELGDLVIARILDRAPPDGRSLTDFGVRIDHDNLAGHLATLRRQRDEYADTYAAEVGRVKLIAQEVGASIRHR
jgi:hypothetical protein